MAFDGIALRRPTEITARGYTILTGHPPVAQQIADQVRSSSGMTYGRARPGGGPAMMPLCFTSPRIAEVAPRVIAPDPAPAADPEPRVSSPDRLLADLLGMEAGGTTLLPDRPELVRRFGRQVVRRLGVLADRQRLKFWAAHQSDRSCIGAVIIRMAGSEREMRTANAPSWMHL